MLSEIIPNKISCDSNLVEQPRLDSLFAWKFDQNCLESSQQIIYDPSIEKRVYKSTDESLDLPLQRTGVKTLFLQISIASIDLEIIVMRKDSVRMSLRVCSSNNTRKFLQPPNSMMSTYRADYIDQSIDYQNLSCTLIELPDTLLRQSDALLDSQKREIPLHTIPTHPQNISTNKWITILFNIESIFENECYLLESISINGDFQLIDILISQHILSLYSPQYFTLVSNKKEENIHNSLSFKALSNESVSKRNPRKTQQENCIEIEQNQIHPQLFLIQVKAIPLSPKQFTAVFNEIGQQFHVENITQTIQEMRKKSKSVNLTKSPLAFAHPSPLANKNEFDRTFRSRIMSPNSFGYNFSNRGSERQVYSSMSVSRDKKIKDTANENQLNLSLEGIGIEKIKQIKNKSSQFENVRYQVQVKEPFKTIDRRQISLNTTKHEKSKDRIIPKLDQSLNLGFKVKDTLKNIQTIPFLSSVTTQPDQYKEKHYETSLKPLRYTQDNHLNFTQENSEEQIYFELLENRDARDIMKSMKLSSHIELNNTNSSQTATNLNQNKDTVQSQFIPQISSDSIRLKNNLSTPFKQSSLQKKRLQFYDYPHHTCKKQVESSDSQTIQHRSQSSQKHRATKSMSNGTPKMDLHSSLETAASIGSSSAKSAQIDIEQKFEDNSYYFSRFTNPQYLKRKSQLHWRSLLSPSEENSKQVGSFLWSPTSITSDLITTTQFQILPQKKRSVTTQFRSSVPRSVHRETISIEPKKHINNNPKMYSTPTRRKNSSLLQTEEEGNMPIFKDQSLLLQTFDISLNNLPTDQSQRSKIKPAEDQGLGDLILKDSMTVQTNKIDGIQNNLDSLVSDKSVQEQSEKSIKGIDFATPRKETQKNKSEQEDDYLQNVKRFTSSFKVAGSNYAVLTWTKAFGQLDGSDVAGGGSASALGSSEQVQEDEFTEIEEKIENKSYSISLLSHNSFANTSNNLYWKNSVRSKSPNHSLKESSIYESVEIASNHQLPQIKELLLPLPSLPAISSFGTDAGQIHTTKNQD